MRSTFPSNSGCNIDGPASLPPNPRNAWKRRRDAAGRPDAFPHGEAASPAEGQDGPGPHRPPAALRVVHRHGPHKIFGNWLAIPAQQVASQFCGLPRLQRRPRALPDRIPRRLSATVVVLISHFALIGQQRPSGWPRGACDRNDLASFTAAGLGQHLAGHALMQRSAMACVPSTCLRKWSWTDRANQHPVDRRDTPNPFGQLPPHHNGMVGNPGNHRLVLRSAGAVHIAGIIGLLLAIAPTLYFWLSGLGWVRVLVFLLLTVIGFIAGAHVQPLIPASSVPPDHAGEEVH